MLDNFATSITYEFPYQDGTVSGLFDALTQASRDHGIQDWGISQTRYDGGPHTVPSNGGA